MARTDPKTNPLWRRTCFVLWVITPCHTGLFWIECQLCQQMNQINRTHLILSCFKKLHLCDYYVRLSSPLSQSDVTLILFWSFNLIIERIKATVGGIGNNQVLMLFRIKTKLVRISNAWRQSTCGDVT